MKFFLIIINIIIIIIFIIIIIIIYVICWLRLWLVLVHAPRVFHHEFSCFSPSTKTNISKFNLESVDEESLCGYATANSHLFILPECVFYFKLWEKFKTAVIVAETGIS